MENLQERILVVDDDTLNVRVLVEFLRGDYSLTIARDGPQALERLQARPLPDLILLDAMMPGMDGYEVCRRIKSDPELRGVPVIMITALNQPFDESAAFDAGAIDFLTKPIAPPVLQARVRAQLRARRSESLLLQQGLRLEEQLRERTRELTLTQAAMVELLGALLALRDPDGSGQRRRVPHYLRILGREAQRDPAFGAALAGHGLDAMVQFAAVHDIGRLALADAPPPPGQRPAGSAERERPRYAAAGRDAMSAALESAGAADIAFLCTGAELVAAHHERWDGSGHPDRLAGDGIPLAGRLMAIAAAYDAALTASPEQPLEARHLAAVARIRADSGSRFDPRLVQAFLAVAGEFLATAGQYPDDPA